MEAVLVDICVNPLSANRQHHQATQVEAAIAERAKAESW